MERIFGFFKKVENIFQNSFLLVVRSFNMLSVGATLAGALHHWEAKDLSLQLPLFLFALQELDIKTERLEFLDQDVERFRKSWFKGMFTFDDGLVHSGATCHVVGFDSQEFLECIGGAVSLHGPDLHLPQPLAAELGLTAERLLGNQTVRSDGTGMDLVVHQMMKFQDVHYPNSDLMLEGVTALAVEQRYLAGSIKASLFHHPLNSLFRSPFENRRSHGYTALKALGHSQKLFILKGVEELVHLFVAIDVLQILLHIRCRGLFLQHLFDLPAYSLGSPAEVSFQYLPDIHTGRDAEGVKHNLHRAAVFHVRHILFGKYPGDYTFITVPARHLIPDLQLPLDGNVDFHHLDHAGRKVVPALQLLDLVVENIFDDVDLLMESAEDLGYLLLDPFAVG